MKRVLVVGGYGNFGRYISRSLAGVEGIALIIAGRSIEKAQALAKEIGAEAVCLDVHRDFSGQLQNIRPDIVIHTSGPFQGQGYDVAEACIAHGAHYIDLADGREFVCGIDRLEEKAKRAKVLVVSGASSVPCLTAALIDHYRHEFASLESVDYGITTAQKTTRGLATTAAILSYTGKPFTTLIEGREADVYGWQGLRARQYSALGRRLLSYCNIPDLQLFPERYPELKTLRFYAGLELPFIHVTLWALSWLVRCRLIRSLEPAAPWMLKLSFLFDRLGSADSGFHLELGGVGKKGESKILTFELVARSGDGPFIPCMPAILLTKKLVSGELELTGATACIGLISKTEYLDALAALDIRWSEAVSS